MAVSCSRLRIRKWSNQSSLLGERGPCVCVLGATDRLAAAVVVVLLLLQSSSSIFALPYSSEPAHTFSFI